MKKQLIILFVITIIILSSTLCSAEMASKYSDVPADAIQDTVIQADGYGSAKPTASPAQASILARRAAIVDAYRNLLETIDGVNLDATTTVQDAMIANDTINAKVNGFLRGAKIVKEGWTPEGAYHVVVSVPMYGKNSLAAIVVPAIRAAEPAFTNTVTGDSANPDNSISTPAISQPAAQVNQPLVTGLILDCRNTSLERTMAPGIFDEDGRVIFSSRCLSDDVLINKGVCAYVDSSSTDYSRAGSNPLVIKPMMLKDYNRNFVVTRADGDKILAADKQSGMLAKAAIVVLIN